MGRIICAFAPRMSQKIVASRQISVVIICCAVILSSLSLCSNGFYELVYGFGLCRIEPNVLAVNTATSAPPYVVVIDPGHGGMDTGAQAVVEEYEVIDMTSACLYELLEADRDFIPVMTRTTDDPDSTQRADIANAAGASLLISLHANSDSRQSTTGFECFPQPPGRTYHSRSLKFAQLIVEQMRAAGHNIRGGEQKTGIRYAYYYGNEKRIVDSTDDKVRSRKSFGILEKVNCPAVLVEQCFISSYSDVENWGNEAGCKKAAQLYYNAIKEYFQTEIT